MHKTYRYHYFYKITNNINGHYYYGIHSTDDIDDGYMGSGTFLRKAYKSYGIENFSKEIIKFFDTRENCSLYESNVVNKDLIRDNRCYNARIGGDNKYVWYHKAESREHLREVMTPANSQNPRVWICKNGDVRYIKKEFLEDFVSKGWELGRKDYRPRKGYNGVRIGEEKKPKQEKKKRIKSKTKIELQRERGDELRRKQEETRKNRINLILSSDVDFTRFGWVSKISSIINLSPQKVNVFMKKYMPDFYKKCFIRKRKKIIFNM